jgi:hypothetical protein
LLALTPLKTRTMEHFILNKKVISLDKNKDTAMPIPVLFNPALSEFIIEVPDEQHQAETVLELAVYKSRGDQKTTKIAVQLSNPTISFRLSDHANLEPNDYMLYSCRANRSVRLLLSIINKN